MMPSSRPFRLVAAASAAARLDATVDFLLELSPGAPATIVGATRGAADDLARRVAATRRATFGIVRLSLTQLAARSALLALARDGKAPGTQLGAEAVATRATFHAVRDASLHYFHPVAGTPGFPRALARTLQQLRLAGVTQDRLAAGAPAQADMSDLLGRFEEAFDQGGAADRAGLLRAATEALRAAPLPGALVLLDVPIEYAAERELAEVLLATTQKALVTAHPADTASLAAFEALGGRREGVGEDRGGGDLGALRAYLFAEADTPPVRRPDGSFEFFSAPGEGRECVEIVRRVLDRAREGARFDEMAILIRSPHQYFGLLEHALHRARIPAWFDRGTSRPHPAGRAFVALLTCAAKGLSASRFAEYLSLGQVPASGPVDALWTASVDEALMRTPAAGEEPDEDGAPPDEEASPDRAIVSGTLRAPWKWEQLLGDASVIGGGPDRWRRRLSGMASELNRKIDEAVRTEGDDSGRIDALMLERDLLAHLQAFAMPIVDTLAAWPAMATWGEWLAHLEALAPRVLRSPGHVLRVLADLRPMSEVGPIDLDEARRVLADRLLTVDAAPPARRFGRVFVGTPQQARGRSFRIVFVPGLAERMFPQKPREDPLLLDDLRQAVEPALPTQDRRLASERLLLQLAVGAASERLYVSYPRIELMESRARVPSFYALDLMRAAAGQLPDHELLTEQAREAGHASLAWPAPADPARAIDEQEHDLAVLRRLLDEPDRETVQGHAHYLLGLNPALRRAVVDRWARGHQRWSPSDGLTRSTPALAGALGSQRLGARAYSASALQKFSACPYQFVLAAIHRLQPLERPEPMQRMDPLTRGSIFHEIQAEFLRTLKGRGELPVLPETLVSAAATLFATFERVAAEAHDQLAPAVERVWDDELSAIRRDLNAWLDYLAHDGAEWMPVHFELAFGRVPGRRDPDSVPDDAVLDGRYRLRGAIDLIEQHRQTGLLRITDHKTGRKPDRIEKVTVGGGAVLQPVLYAMAAEEVLRRRVGHSRLFYCTSTGGFHEQPIPLNDSTRASGLEVLQVIDRAIEAGFLAAAPTDEACGWCDFRQICGRDVVRRVARKPSDPLADLAALRRLP